PLLAAVNGPAVGGGFALALVSDLRVASESATFGFSQVRRGIPPSYGAARAVLPPALARELCLTGRMLDAREALAVGLVSSVVSDEELLARARAMASELAPPNVTGLVKRLARAERAAGALESGLALWRGPPLADLAYEGFARAEAGRLDELRVAAQEMLIDAKLALGRHDEVVEQCEVLVAEHPYRERLRAQLMLALYRCDRQADALQAYQDARRQLVDELGIEPGGRLRDLEAAILAQDPGLHLVVEERAPAEAPAVRPRRGFVGRDAELAEL